MSKVSVYLFILMCVLIMLTNSCKKDDDKTPNSVIIFNSDLTYGSVTDIEGNVYKTIIIGTQTWMAENLKVTKYRNGGPIPNITDGTEWSNLSTGAYCDNENAPNNSITYGNLYNWYAVDSRYIAPAGWHVPTDDEWTILTDYLGGDSVAGGKLKETGISHWCKPNTRATNKTGFTALPGGDRLYNGSFNSVGFHGYWWSSTESNSKIAFIRLIYSDYNTVYRGTSFKEDGYSIRCVKDN